MSYLDLGYDDNLLSPLFSPDFISTANSVNFEGWDSSQIVKLGKITSPNGQFYIDFDNNHIEVDSINWEKGFGGTLTLGGANNVNGVLSIKDATNTEKVLLDKDGITVSDGKITIKNDSGDTTIDSKGIVSTANFASDTAVSLNNTRTTSSTSFVNVSNTTLTFTLTRSANVLFLLWGDFSNYGGDGDIASEYVALKINSTLYPDATNGFGNVFYWADQAGSDVSFASSSWHGHYLAQLAAGSYTALMQFRKQGAATVDARVIDTGITYIILGN